MYEEDINSKNQTKSTIIWMSVSALFFLVLGIFYNRFYPLIQDPYPLYPEGIFIYILSIIIGLTFGFLVSLFIRYWNQLQLFHVTKSKILITIVIVLLSPIGFLLLIPLPLLILIPSNILGVIFASDSEPIAVIFFIFLKVIFIPFAIHTIPAYLLSNIITYYHENERNHTLFTYFIFFFLIYSIFVMGIISLLFGHYYI